MEAVIKLLEVLERLPGRLDSSGICAPDCHAARSRGDAEDPRAPWSLALGAESRPRPSRIRRSVLIGSTPGRGGRRRVGAGGVIGAESAGPPADWRRGCVWP